MGIRKRKPAVAPARPQQQPLPVDSAYAAEVRQRAENLVEPVENTGKNGVRIRSYQRQQAEQQMAKLRGEAVQARRLAEHIEYLSQDTAAYKHKRKHVMTDTTIVDPGHAQRKQRRADDKPGPSGNRRNFNPLHPSMELPPEQLIRLLGMESKKIRKSRKARHTSKRAAANPLKTVDAEVDNTPPPAKAQPQAVSPVDTSIQYERCEPPQVFDNGRSGLLVPSVLVGVVAGIAISGYLFWYQPVDTASQKTPVPAVAKQPQKPQPKRQLVKRPPAPAPKQEMSAQEKVEWQASIEAQEQRLRAAAEQRLAERVSQLQQTSRQAELQPAPEPAITPEPVNSAASPVGTMVETPLETSTELGSGGPLPKPVSAAVETPDAQESPAEAIQPDAGVLPVRPGESAAVLPAAVPVEEVPAYENAETGEMPVIEPAPAEPVATDIPPEVPPQSEADPVLTPVTPAAPADNNLL